MPRIGNRKGKAEIAEAELPDESLEESTPRRKGSRTWRKYFIGFALLVAILIVFAPMALQSKSVVLGILARTGAVEPLKIDMESIGFGWFKPLCLKGVTVTQDDGKPLCRVGSVDTELSLWRLLTNRQSLGTIVIDHFEATVEVEKGTTSVERALEKILAKFQNAPSESSDSSAGSTALKLVMKDSVVHAVDALTQEAWDLDVRQAIVDMDGSSKVLPKVAVGGKLSQRHPATGVAGQFLVKVQDAATAGDDKNVQAKTLSPASVVDGSESSLSLLTSAELETLPLMWISLVKRRFPDLPLESGAGWVSLKAQGVIHGADQWRIDVTEGTMAQVMLSAPQWLGAQPAAMQQATWSGSWQLAGGKLQVIENRLNCDFGEASGTATLPWPLTPPAPTAPWIAQGEFDVRSKVDLPKLMQVAPSLVPIRDNMVLISGAADLVLKQKLDTRGLPQSRYELTLGDLEANIQGQSIRWEDPLAAVMQVQPDAAGEVRFQGEMKAEFCDFQASGSLEGGRISGQVDLPKLKKRLDEFVTLPLERVDGSADGTVSWEKSAEGLIQLNGEVQTTPLVLRTQGGELTEPAWRGEADLTLRLVGNRLHRIDRGRVRLLSNTEEAIVELFEPVLLPSGEKENAADKLKSVAAIPPASARIKFLGDMAAWQRRMMLWNTWQPDIALRGKLDFEAAALVDASHVEVTKANWMAEPLEVQTSQWKIAEPQMKGEFQGRIDSQNLTRLEIASLEVQAASFALRAADNVKIEGEAENRVGAGAFRINLANLTSSMNSPTAIAPNTDPSRNPIAPLGSNNGRSVAAAPQPLPLRLSGEIVGNASWIVTKKGLTWKVTADGTDILAESNAPRSVAPGALVSTSPNPNRGANSSQKIWEEQRIRTVCEGSWDAATGAVKMSQTDLQTGWVAYAGQLVWDPTHQSQALNMNGKYTYDAAKVTERMQQYLAGWVALEGQRTEPLDVTLLKLPEGATTLSGLNADTKLGWERASAIGLNIGAAEIPVKIDRGILQLASAIPINQGKVQFDMTADLSKEPLRIVQKKGTVLDHVDITPQMYQGWLQYVTPILASATSAEGSLSLDVDYAELVPTDLMQQNIAGKVTVHSAAIGPGPLSSSILQVVQYVNAIRKGEFNVANALLPMAGGVANPLAASAVPNANPPAATNPGSSPVLQSLGGQWLQIKDQSIDFEVKNGQVIHRNFTLMVGDVEVKSMGRVGLDGSMEMLLSVPIQNAWVEKQNYLQSLSGKSLDIPVRGTLAKPEVDWRTITTLTSNLAAGTAMQAGQNAIQRELNKQLQRLPLDKLEKPFETLDKLFGPSRQP
jgi:hypothetical protein